MTEDTIEKDGTVYITMELNGEYDHVINKLAIDEDFPAEIREAMRDFERLLETIDDIDGGTKSVILDHLPAEMAVDYDTDTVVNALQVLERYDLVTLDGNTWNVSL